MKNFSRNYLKIMLISFVLGVLISFGLGGISYELGGMLYENLIINIIMLIIMLIGIICLCLSGFIFYFIPTFVAINKNHPQCLPIEIINLFLGWSLLGWVVALVWACMENNTKSENISGNKYENLSKLQKLKEDGIISEEEFEKEKSKLLR